MIFNKEKIRAFLSASYLDVTGSYLGSPEGEDYGE